MNIPAIDPLTPTVDELSEGALVVWRRREQTIPLTNCKDRRHSLRVFGDILYTSGSRLTSRFGPRKSTSAMG